MTNAWGAAGSGWHRPCLVTLVPRVAEDLGTSGITASPLQAAPPKTGGALRTGSDFAFSCCRTDSTE